MENRRIAFEVLVPGEFSEIVERCKQELSREGFGVLCEIDIQAKLREKLGVDTPPHCILGACHPPSAHRALSIAPEVDVLLPCNVTVTAAPTGCIVRAMDAEAAMQVLGNQELLSVAQEVSSRLRRVLARVAGHADSEPGLPFGA